MDQICVCLPVRYGSSRLPGKPLYLLGNMTVIERTINQVLKSKYITKEQLFIFTDHQEIADAVTKLGIIVIMTDSDCENALVRLSRYAHLLPEQYQTIINLHGDEPFLEVKNVDLLIEQYLKKPEPQLLIRKLEQEDVPKLCQVKAVTDLNGYLIYCSRAWLPHTKDGNLPESSVIYYGNIGVHLIDRQNLIKYDQTEAILYKIEDVEELKLVEMGIKINCVIAQYPAERSLNTEDDYKYFQALVASNN